METHRRGSDGRRIFTTAFKQEQVGRVVRQEVTVAELARELAVSPSVVRRWHHLSANGSSAAVSADEDVVPASEWVAGLHQGARAGPREEGHGDRDPPRRPGRGKKKTPATTAGPKR